VLWTIAAILCAVTAIEGAEIVWLFLLAGAFGAIYYGGSLPKLGSNAASVSPAGVLAAVKGLAWTGSGATLGPMAVFFAKAGAFTFGSGLAIVPLLHQGLVDDHHWLTEQQFVDAVAMGLISPGYFDLLKQPLSASQVGPAKGHVTAYLNAKRFSGDPRTIPLQAHALIQLDVGTPPVAPAPFTFPARPVKRR